jgi:hypothetical protein
VKLEIIRGLKAQILEADRVLVTTDDGTPIAVVSEYAKGAHFASHAGEPDFNRMLETLGIHRTTILTAIQAPRLDDFDLTR